VTILLINHVGVGYFLQFNNKKNELKYEDRLKQLNLQGNVEN
jgi:hypothetical protein